MKTDVELLRESFEGLAELLEKRATQRRQTAKLAASDWAQGYYTGSASGYELVAQWIRNRLPKKEEVPA